MQYFEAETKVGNFTLKGLAWIPEMIKYSEKDRRSIYRTKRARKIQTRAKLQTELTKEFCY